MKGRKGDGEMMVELNRIVEFELSFFPNRRFVNETIVQDVQTGRFVFIVLKKGMKPRFNRSNEKLLLVVSDDLNCSIFGVER